MVRALTLGLGLVVAVVVAVATASTGWMPGTLPWVVADHLASGVAAVVVMWAMESDRVRRP